MSGYEIKDERNFLSTYYDSLCNDINNLNRLYSNESKMTICFENGKNVTFTENFNFNLKQATTKMVKKVLISTLTTQNVEDRLMIMAIGQFLFTDNTQTRFSHQFYIDRTNTWRILNEIIVLLNEEILYENMENKLILNISNKKKTLSEIIEILQIYGKIDSVINQDTFYVCKLTVDEDDINEIKKKIEETGLEILN